MRMPRRTFFGAALAICLPFRVLLAQGYPSRPITFLCPWPAGGGGDLQMRVLAKLVGANLGEKVVVENKPGATGTLAAAGVARMKADGYAVAQSHDGVLRQPFITPSGYDPAVDFTYIIGVSENVFGLVVKTDSPWRTFQEFMEYARQNPNAVSIAVPGRGSPGHRVCDSLIAAYKMKWTIVPYKGSVDSLNGLMGGHVTAAAEASTWVTHVDSGRLRLLAVFGSRRLKRYPNVPTLKDLGLDIVEFSPWGIVGPAGMEQAVVKTVHDAVKRAMDDPEFIALLETLGQEPIYMSSDAYRKYALEAIPFQKAVVEKYGLRQS